MTGARTVLLVLLVALVSRLVSPPPFVTWDEPTWTYRSLQFLRGLETGRLEATYQSAHPGVLTMWAGSAGIAVRSVLPGAGGADRAWVEALPPYDEDDPQLLGAVMPWWPAARTALGFLTALLVAAVTALALRLFAPRAALAAGLLLALDPYLLAHSRVLHLDAVLALTLLVSVMALLVRLTGRGGNAFVLASGAAAGLAVAEKSPGVTVLPVVLLFLAAWVLGARGRRVAAAAAAVRLLVLWCLAAAVAYVAVWPALWVAPADTLGRMAAYARASAGGAREAVFFAGAVHRDPGTVFYLAAIVLRASPLLLLGLAGLPAVLAGRGARQRPSGSERAAALGLLGFALAFTLLMGAGEKKFERYILPAVPPLHVAAGLGLAWWAETLTRYRPRRRAPAAAGARAGPVATAPRWAATAVLLALAAAQAVHLAGYRPYFLAYYNPVLGGGATAARWLPVGWGEGADLAAGWLNALPDAERLTLATPSVPLLSPLFSGRTLKARHWESSDYVLLYVDDVQIGRPELAATVPRQAAPSHVVTLFGIDYAWIYDRRDLP